MDRQLISSGSPYEPSMGFSRAVRVGQHVFVAGTAPVMPDGEEPPDDATADEALPRDHRRRARARPARSPSTSSARGSSSTSAGIFEEVARAHGAVFGEARPACTFVVTELIDPRWLVEIEAEA